MVLKIYPQEKQRSSAPYPKIICLLYLITHGIKAMFQASLIEQGFSETGHYPSMYIQPTFPVKIILFLTRFIFDCVFSLLMQIAIPSIKTYKVQYIKIYLPMLLIAEPSLKYLIKLVIPLICLLNQMDIFQSRESITAHGSQKSNLPMLGHKIASQAS